MIIKHRNEPIMMTSNEKVKLLNEGETIVEVLIVNGEGVLHWTDAKNLMQVNKYFFSLWKKKYEQIFLRPLLKELESMSSTHFNNAYQQLDPRFDYEYRSYSIEQKCIKMLNFLSFIMKNIWRNFDFEDLNNPSKLHSSISGGWAFADDPLDLMFKYFPKRAALLMNLALLGMAKYYLEYNYGAGEFEEGFILGNISNGFGPSFRHFIVESVDRMLRSHGDDYHEFVSELLPTKATLDLIGPLTKKVTIGAPLRPLIPFAENMDLEEPEKNILPKSWADALETGMEWDPE